MASSRRPCASSECAYQWCGPARPRIQFQGPAELALRAVGVPVVVQLDDSHRGVGLGQVLVEGEGLSCGCAGFGHHFLGPDSEVFGKVGVGIRQSAVGQRELRVALDGLLIAVDGFEIGIRNFLLVKKVAALLVQVISCKIRGGLTLRNGPGAQLVRDGLRDLLLHLEYVAQLTLVGSRPQVRTIGDAIELRGDAQLVAGFADAAFQDRVDVKLPADLANIVALPLNAKAEVRATTRRFGTRLSASIISSVRPSLKYSWSFCGLRSRNGRTTTEDGLAPGGGDVWRFHSSEASGGEHENRGAGQP